MSSEKQTLVGCAEALLSTDEADSCSEAQTLIQPQVAINLIPHLVNDKQLMTVMKKTNYDAEVCCAGIRLLKSEENILFVMEKTKYNSLVCAVGVVLLKTDEQKMSIMEKTGYDAIVRCVGIRLLKSEENIMSVLKSSGYSATSVEIVHLKSEENILLTLQVAIKRGGYIYEILCAGMKKLELPNKTVKQILTIMKQLQYNRIVCEHGIEAMGLSKKSKEQILDIIEETDFNNDVCRITGAYLKAI